MVSYQASSPDEVALVEWADWAGLKLTNRTLAQITLSGWYNDVIETTNKILLRKQRKVAQTEPGSIYKARNVTDGCTDGWTK